MVQPEIDRVSKAKAKNMSTRAPLGMLSSRTGRK